MKMVSGSASVIAALAVLAVLPVQARADSLQQTVAARIAETREANDLPAIGAIVMVGGETLALAVDGTRRAGKDDPVTVDDKWHLGSITKSMTATLAGQLVEQGRLDWDTTLAEMLPDIAPEMDPQWQAVTLEQLLTHTAGAPGNVGIAVQFSWPETEQGLMDKRREVVAGALAIPPVTEPGTAYAYSNLGFVIAGHAIETLYGVPWEQVMRDKLYGPLDLGSAGFGAPVGDQPWGHQKVFGFRMAKDPENRADNTPVIGPAGTAHMALADLAAYGNHHLTGELGLQDGYLQPGTYEALHTPALDDYAKGWVVWERDWADGDGDGTGTVIWHNGSNTMWYALLVLVPEQNAVIGLVTNEMGENVQGDFFGLAEALATSLPHNDTMTGE